MHLLCSKLIECRIVTQQLPFSPSDNWFVTQPLIFSNLASPSAGVDLNGDLGLVKELLPDFGVQSFSRRRHGDEIGSLALTAVPAAAKQIPEVIPVQVLNDAPPNEGLDCLYEFDPELWTARASSATMDRSEWQALRLGEAS